MTRKKGGLSRGLGAFITDKNKVEEILKPSNTLEVIEINLSDIVANKDQPRKDFEEESLKELSNSILTHGVIQPIIVRKKENKFEIVAGERRYRASLMANKKSIPAIVRDLDDYEQENFSLIENIQRKDLNPYEEALAYKSIIDKYEMTQDDLAKAVGKSRPYISNTIRLLRLDKRVLELLKTGDLSYSMGRELLSIKDEEKQYERALEILQRGLSVKEVANKKKKKAKNHSGNKNIHLAQVEENFMDRLGTKVSIDDNKKVISINYYDNEDLQRIIEIIVGE